MHEGRIELLISPKNVEEAKTIVGTSDVRFIDCKNPIEGSLGANFPWVIKGMKKLIRENSTQLLSATIGDFPYLPGSASLAALGAVISGADIVKVGLKEPENEKQGINLMKNVVKAVKDYDDKKKVVVAGYADRSRMRSSPSYLEIPIIASKSGADIAMLDTYIKDGKGLFDFLNVEELIQFKDEAKKLNIDVALAGNLMKKDLEKIKQIKPDIIGVRSIVCDQYDRNNFIKAELIEDLKLELYH